MHLKKKILVSLTKQNVVQRFCGIIQILYCVHNCYSTSVVGTFAELNCKIIVRYILAYFVDGCAVVVAFQTTLFIKSFLQIALAVCNLNENGCGRECQVVIFMQMQAWWCKLYVVHLIQTAGLFHFLGQVIWSPFLMFPLSKISLRKWPIHRNIHEVKSSR